MGITWAVVMLVVAACGAGEAAPETIPTSAAAASVPGTLSEADVATYEAANLGFTIDHPSDWDVEEDLDHGIVSFYGRLVPGDRFVENYNVAVVELVEEMDLETFTELDAVRLAVSVEGYEAVTGSETTLDGVPAVTVVFDGTTSGVALRFFRLVAVRNATAFEFTFAASRGEFENFLPVIDQMLAGFRFRD